MCHDESIDVTTFVVPSKLMQIWHTIFVVLLLGEGGLKKGKGIYNGQTEAGKIGVSQLSKTSRTFVREKEFKINVFLVKPLRSSIFMPFYSLNPNPKTKGLRKFQLKRLELRCGFI